MTVDEAIKKLQEFADEGWDHCQVMIDTKGKGYEQVSFCITEDERENYFIEVY